MSDNMGTANDHEPNTNQDDADLSVESASNNTTPRTQMTEEQTPLELERDAALRTLRFLQRRPLTAALLMGVSVALLLLVPPSVIKALELLLMALGVLFTAAAFGTDDASEEAEDAEAEGETTETATDDTAESETAEAETEATSSPRGFA